MRTLQSLLPLLIGALVFVVLSSAPQVVFQVRGLLQEAAVTITLLTPTWEAAIVALIAAWISWVLLGKWWASDLLVETPEEPAPETEQVLRDQNGRRPHQAVRHAIMEGRK